MATDPASLRTAFERAAGRYPAEPPRARTVAVREQPRISVALASHNRRDTLALALDALGKQSYPRDRFEVVVVLDGSTDGSAELVRATETPYALKLVEQDQSGLAAARNRGAAEAGGDVLVFTDDDILLEEDCLTAYAEAHGGQADHIVFGAAWPEVGTDVWAGLVRDWWQRDYRRKAEPGHKWTFVDVADGMACLPRQLFIDSGGFDEAFRERRQDWEWGVRLCRQGVRLSQSLEAAGRHLVDTSVGTAVRYARAEGRSDVQLGQKHPEVRGRLLVASLAAAAGSPHPRARLAYDHPRASTAAAWGASRLVAALNKTGAARSVTRLLARLRMYGYAMGVRDALDRDRDALDEFLAPVTQGDGARTLVVDLARPAPLEVPAVGGALALSLQDEGREIARVPALEPTGQWDWDSLAERVAEAVRRHG